MRRVADDGVGLAVAERVSGLGLSKVDVAKYGEDACALMEAWEGYGNVILVDATQSGAMPGTVRSFDSRAMPPTKTRFRHIDPRLRLHGRMCSRLTEPSKRNCGTCKEMQMFNDRRRSPPNSSTSLRQPKLSKSHCESPGHAWGQLVAPGGHGHRPQLGGLQGARVRRPWYFRIEWC